MSNNTILKALERMGYKGRMTGHGFRGLASTILHEQGYAHDHIELQLAHAPRNAVSAAYNHALYLEPRARDDAGLGGFSGADPTWRQGAAVSRLGRIEPRLRMLLRYSCPCASIPAASASASTPAPGWIACPGTPSPRDNLALPVSRHRAIAHKSRQNLLMPKVLTPRLEIFR